MVAAISAAVVFVFAYGAELLHARRVRRIAALAFGPSSKAARWTLFAPLLRVTAISALCWGLVTLMLIEPKIHKATSDEDKEPLHLLMVLDVSPSMRLKDAGLSKKKISRMQRASILMESFFDRVNMNRYRVSVIAVYNGSKRVVEETKDMEVVRNIMGDLPMHHAFASGETDLFSGLEEASVLAKNWNPRTGTLLLISDGDTVPSAGMPKMPVSIGNVLVLGVGDNKKGSFINGRHSRQDVSTLRQIAVRLGGTYHNGNEKHISTELLKQISVEDSESVFEQLTLREYALFCCGLSSLILALLPLMLHYWGTRWNPGVPVQRESQSRQNQQPQVEQQQNSLTSV